MRIERETTESRGRYQVIGQIDGTGTSYKRALADALAKIETFIKGRIAAADYGWRATWAGDPGPPRITGAIGYYPINHIGTEFTITMAVTIEMERL